MLPGIGSFSLLLSAIKRASKLLPAVAIAGFFAASHVAAWGQVSAPGPYNFGAVPANTSSTHTLTFTFTGSATVGSVSVVTEGVSGKDFQPQANDPSTTLCAGRSFNSGGTCTVDVTFSPLAIGRRIGEIQLSDGSGNRLATAYLSGWGQGALLVSGSLMTSTIAGIDNTPGYNYDPASNTGATTNELNSPRGVVTDLNGNIYIADAGNRVIRQVTPSGIISTVAGIAGQAASSCQALVNAPALSTAAFAEPGGGMAIDAAGNLIVGDLGLHCVYSINLQAETITTIMGQAGPDDTDGYVPGKASGVELSAVGGVGVDGAGNIYVGTAGHILKIDPSLNVTAVAGTGNPGTYSGDGGPATSAVLSNPCAIVFDAAGELVFTDYSNGRVLKIDSAGNVHALLGGGTTSVSALPATGSPSNVLATNVNAGFLWGVAFDGPGNFYATSAQYGQIIQVDVNGLAYRFAGTATGTPFGESDDQGDNDCPDNSKESSPSGLWITPAGDILVADFYAADVRRFGYTPLSQTTLTFAATQIGHKSSDSPQSASLTNIGNAPLAYTTPATGTNPTISPSFSVDSASTCQQPSTAPTSVLALGASCTYAVDFIPVTSGAITGALTIAGNVFGGTASIQLHGTGIKVVDTLVVTAPPTAVAGTPITVNVTAYYQGSIATTFTGPVTITSTDGKAILPAPVTLTAGVGSFSATLETTGIQTITATDVSGVTGISNNILVTAASPNQILPVSGTGQQAIIGTAFANPLKVEVLDQYNNPVGGATVTFSAPASGASAIFTPATCTTSTTAPVGYCSVIATANGIASATAYTASASASGVASPATFSLTNLQSPTTLTVTPSATSLVYGQPVAVSAGISPSSAGGSVPTGLVTFYDGAANALSPNSAVSGASASYSVAVPAVGTHNYFAKYLGDSNFVASAQTAATSAVVVNKAPVTITGPASPLQVAYGSATTVPLTVAGPYSGPGILAPTGALSYEIVQSSNILASGTLTISAAAAVVPVPSTLAPGTYTVMAWYSPGDANYAAGAGYAAVVTLQVGKITPIVTFTSPGSSIVYGTALNVSALATWKSNPVAGTMAYTATPAGGSAITVNASTILSAGSYTLTANFTPTDTNTYGPASGSMTLTVTKATPALTWANPAAITYGMPLGGTQFNATAAGVTGAALPGTFTYTPATGNIPNAGSVSLSVQFVPTDSTDYSSATKQVALTVNKASVTVAGPASQPVAFGFNQGGSLPVTITGQFSGPGITPPSGMLDYSILNGSNVSVGSGAPSIASGGVSVPVATSLVPGPYTVDVVYPGDTNYLPTSTPIVIAIAIGQIQPVIHWPNPSPITYGATLSGILNAIAMDGANVVSGSYAYLSGATAITPSTVLPAGTYTLSVSFAPNDAVTYKTASGSVTLVVNQALPGASVTSSANPVLLKNPTTLTATVSSSVSIPTGTVTFLDGTTPIGTGPLVNGIASLTVSSLATGKHSITAAYAGDSNFLAISSGPLSQHVDDFSIAAGGTTSQNIFPGAQTTYQFTLMPVGDATFPANISLTPDGQPSDATITINPSSVNSGSGATNFTVTVATPSLTGAARPANSLGKGAAPFALALLLLPFSRRMRRQARKFGRLGQMLLLLISLGAALFGATGCGSTTGFFAHPPQTYTINVTGASGPLSHAASVTLTVE